MRRLTALSLLLVAATPAVLSAQDVNARRESLSLLALSETRRLPLLPSESVGFRVFGAADKARALRVSTGHLVAGRYYHAVARIVPRDGSTPLRTEGTISSDAPQLDLGLLPAGEYLITVHLEDYATGSTRDARNKVVLR